MKMIRAFAKINIFLEVTGVRPDGFHDIDTVMQTVSLCDDLYFAVNGSGVLSLDCPDVPGPQEKNLVWRAARLYLDRAGLNDGIDIKVEKRIPQGAGLGGGSADAAAALRCLNGIYGAFSRDGLLALAAELGSDVPFCVAGGAARAEGRGEILSPLPRILPDCFIVTAKGGLSTSTAEAYKKIDALEYTPKINDTAGLFETGDLEKICRSAFNRFEDAAAFDREAADILSSHGALAARMTGSGSAVYGVFTDENRAEAAKDELLRTKRFAAVCRPVRTEE